MNKKKLTLTHTQERALRNLVEGRESSHGCKGQSEFGGHERVMWSLRKRGFVENGEITEAGRAVLELAGSRSDMTELDEWCDRNQGSWRCAPATSAKLPSCQLTWWRPNKARSKTFEASTPPGARALAAAFCRANPNAR